MMVGHGHIVGYAFNFNGLCECPLPATYHSELLLYIQLSNLQNDESPANNNNNNK